MAKYGKGTCAACKRSIALTSFGKDATVWRHDPPKGTGSRLVSCPGSWEAPINSGPIAPAGTPAVQPPLSGIEQQLFAFPEDDPEPEPAPRAAESEQLTFAA